jgi:hypothetical protein
MYLVTILVLVIGLVAIFIYSNIQKKELQNMLQQKEISIGSLNDQIQRLKDQVVNLSIEKETGMVSGKITLATGNCMPVVCDHPPPCVSGCSLVGVSRKVYIREVVNSSDVDINHYLKKESNPNLVKIINSRSDGLYIAILPVGNYSLFVEDDGNEYCNSFNLQGNLCFFEIKNNQTTDYDFLINHASW